MYMSAFLVLAVTLAPAAFGSQKSPDPAQATATQSCTSSEDDTAIYSAVLKEVISKTQSDKTQIVLLSQTSSGYPPGMAGMTSVGTQRKELLDTTDAVTKTDFDAKTKLHCDLATNIEPLGKVVILNCPSRRKNSFPRAVATGKPSRQNTQTQKHLRLW